MIGREVRRQRERLGLTGAQLAERAGLAPSAVSQIETGKRTPNSASVIKLAAGLGVEVGDLYPKGQAPLPDFDDAQRRELDYWIRYLTHLADHFEDLAGEEVEPCRRYGWGDVVPGVAGDALTVVEALLDGVRDGTVVATTAAVRSALRAGFRLAKAADRIDELATPSEEDLFQGVRRRQAQVLTEIRFRQIVEAFEDVVSEENRDAIFS